MTRSITVGSLLYLLLALPTADLFAQGNPYAPQYNPYARPAADPADPRARRAQRERAVAYVGAIARDFVETQSDEAVAAIAACSKPVAVKLAEFHASGDLNKLPRPRDLLRVIAQYYPGDDVALWAIQHARDLTDTDNFDAYLLNPLEYALGLKQLSDGAAEARARRLTNQTATVATAATRDDWKVAAIGAALLASVGLLIWWRRQRQAA